MLSHRVLQTRWKSEIVALDNNSNSPPLLGGLETIKGWLENLQDCQRNRSEEENIERNWCPHPTHPHMMCCDLASAYLILLDEPDDEFSWKVCVLSEEGFF